MRRILIPLNISEISPTILPVVRRLFEPTEAELILLGITQRTNDYEFACACGPDGANIGYYVPSPDGEWQAYRQKFEVELKHLAQTLREVGYHVHTLVRIGEPVEQIVAVAEKGNYDLLAMATRGRTGLSRLLFGSVAETVLRQVTLPVLLFRPVLDEVAKPQKTGKPNAIVYPVHANLAMN
ncbi:MAG: universal stress protein [Caldilineaceae bacterium]